jgi:hypothetical protein
MSVVGWRWVVVIWPLARYFKRYFIYANMTVPYCSAKIW